MGTATSKPCPTSSPVKPGADDLVRIAAQLDRAADHRRVAAVLALPECVAQHGDRRGAALAVVVVGEEAPQRGPYAERREELAAREHRVREARLAGRLEAEP